MNDINEFKKYVQKMRKKEFFTPFDFVYDIFIKSGECYSKKDKDWFRNNASKFVMDMRDKDWDAFSAKESRFTIKMLKSLIDNDEIEGKEPLKAVEWFIEHNSVIDKITERGIIKTDESPIHCCKNRGPRAFFFA